jgi:hypothetical protein
MIIIKRKGKVNGKEGGRNCSAALRNQLQHDAAFLQKYETLAVPLD